MSADSERRDHARPLAHPYGVHVVDVTGLVGRKLAELAETELGVAPRGLTARDVPVVQPLEEQPSAAA